MKFSMHTLMLSFNVIVKNEKKHEDFTIKEEILDSEDSLNAVDKKEEKAKDSTCNVMITSDMQKEEENLENEGKKEEEKVKEEHQKVIIFSLSLYLSTFFLSLLAKLG